MDEPLIYQPTDTWRGGVNSVGRKRISVKCPAHVYCRKRIRPPLTECLDIYASRLSRLLLYIILDNLALIF